MNILIVDDNPDFLSMLNEILFLHGYNTFSAEDGLEGSTILTSQEIDLIISDIKMPTFDGIKLHSFVRNLDAYRRTKFVFLSGHREEFKDIITLDPEIDFFLNKTTSVSEIVRVVDELLFGTFAGTWV
ncbi:MAG: response regulator [Ignavibacteriae bacterium]|nr:response regulator [Ignavibacteriota bacterium]